MAVFARLWKWIRSGCRSSGYKIRQYQRPFKKIQMPHNYSGYTNRILIQEDGATQNYYIPVYVIFKIKSIQEIDIQKLSGSISCVIIINVMIQNLPEPLVHLLKNQMNIQLNRSQLIQLKEDHSNNISMEVTQKMVKFTLRRNITCSIVQQTLWSPFEIIRLIISITFNSIKRNGESLYMSCWGDKASQINLRQQKIRSIAQLGKQSVRLQYPSIDTNLQKQSLYIFDKKRNYNISFNCMRNGGQIPISYALGCSYSIFHLAQNLLESYHTNADSYNQIIRTYKDRKKLINFDQKQNKPNQPKIKTETNQLNNMTQTIYQKQFTIAQKDNGDTLDEYINQIFQNSSKDQQGNPKSAFKAKYFQFSHFIIPLYKYPLNSLLTMFVPIFLLALLSLAIFFQQKDLSNRIGSIATLVLGYIALIPSVKSQLPPTSKITVVEIVIYISTLCCLFSLIESFLIFENDVPYEFVWIQNKLFMVCLVIHGFIFTFIIGLFFIHKCIWERSYIHNYQVNSPDPQKQTNSWINLYCDQQFYRTNQNIYNYNKNNQNKQLKQEQFNKLLKQRELNEKRQVKPHPIQKQSHKQTKKHQKKKDLIKNYVPNYKKNKQATVTKSQSKNKNEQNTDDLQKLQLKRSQSIVSETYPETPPVESQQINPPNLKKSKSKKANKQKKVKMEQKLQQQKQVPENKPPTQTKGITKQQLIKCNLKYKVSLQFLDNAIGKGGHILLQGHEDKRPQEKKEKKNQKRKSQ